MTHGACGVESHRGNELHACLFSPFSSGLAKRVMIGFLFERKNRPLCSRTASKTRVLEWPEKWNRDMSLTACSDKLETNTVHSYLSSYDTFHPCIEWKNVREKKITMIYLPDSLRGYYLWWPSMNISTMVISSSSCC